MPLPADLPNLTYLALHFFHTLALALWVGGGFAIGALVAPAAFAATDASVAGRIVGDSLRRFERVVYVCIALLAVTSVLMVAWYGRWSRWYAIEYACITLMSASALYSGIVLTPRLRRLRGRMRTGTDPEAEEEFRDLHRIAAMAMQFNLACGVVAILFS